MPSSSPRSRPTVWPARDESATMPELLALPFSDLFTVIEKDSVCVALGTELDAWLEAHPEVTTFLTVGDCTDFCTHRLAMHLRLRANVLHQPEVRVILPVDGVDTFHIPVDVARNWISCPMTAICCTSSFSSTWPRTVSKS